MKRTTPLKRTPFAPAEPKPAKGPRKRKCACCRVSFVPMTPMGRACSIKCAISIATEARKKQERKDDKLRRQALNTRQDWLREAQAAWNRYVRLRDAGKPCCSCGAMPEQKYGGTMDCSHYRSRGSAPHLKFHLHNAASACVKCNRFLGGNIAALRAGLIDRIGLDKVLAVESDNTPRKFDQTYLIRIKNIFTKKAKRIQNKLKLHTS